MISNVSGRRPARLTPAGGGRRAPYLRPLVAVRVRMRVRMLVRMRVRMRMLMRVRVRVRVRVRPAHAAPQRAEPRAAVRHLQSQCDGSKHTVMKNTSRPKLA